MTFLLVENLTVRYGEQVAVRQASLSLPEGTFLAVTGESGAGKSSLLWATAGLIRYDGTVTLNGVVRPTGVRPGPEEIGLLPQTYALAAMLTAYENVAYPLLARGLGAAETRAAAESALVALGLDGFGDHLRDELSGGQQQRVALARMLAVPPRVMLVDEPTSALDHGNRSRVLELLAGAAAAGAVVVMATHDSQAAAAADGEMIIDEGCLSWRRPLGGEA